MDRRRGAAIGAEEIARLNMGETQMSELDYWNARLLKGAVSRREFMACAAALGVSSAAISTLLVSADALAADTPRKGGVLETRPSRRQHDRQRRRHHVQ